MLPFEHFPPLRAYLQAVRHVVFDPPNTATTRTILVMGNTSADLDSFISAITFSYFRNHEATAPRNAIYIPILNMPKTPSTDLWRLRPEFGVALRMANSRSGVVSQSSDSQVTERALLNEVITIKDLLDSDSTCPDLLQIFRSDLSESSDEKAEIMLVDHNAPSITIPRIPTSSILGRLEVVGCIDHHIDEHFVPETASPRIITTGIGSCTTLVVSDLRKSGIWPKSKLPPAELSAIAQMSHLALAPILIDTNNLKATGEKCSDLDRAIAATLEIEMGASTAMLGIKSSWNRDSFYEPIVDAKKASLDLLSAQEMFERDYKSWVEGDVEIGISSLVRPVSWLVEHFEGGAEELAAEVTKFANDMQEQQTNDGVKFEVYLMLTPGQKAKGKEIVVVCLSDRMAKAVEGFEKKADEGDLRLKEWDDGKRDEVARAFGKEFGEAKFKVYWMTNREKTRKQGAPIVREAVAEILKS